MATNEDKEKKMDVLLEGSIDIGIEVLDLRVSELVENDDGPDYHTVVVDKPRRDANGDLSYKPVGRGHLLRSEVIDEAVEQ